MKKYSLIAFILFLAFSIIAGSVAAPALAGSGETNTFAYRVFIPIAMGGWGLVDVTPPPTCLEPPVIDVEHTFKVKPYNTSVGYEDLDLTAETMDFDYNDWITDIKTDLCYYLIPNTAIYLWQIDLAIIPQARGAALDHAYHIDFPANIFQSDGVATLTKYDQFNNIIGSPVVQPFLADQVNMFTLVDPTSNALPGSIVNTVESRPSVAIQGYATLSIRFDEPFWFDVTPYNPSQPGNEHGEKLFFEPHLFVYKTPTYEVRPGSPLMLVVPFLEWKWPEERVNIWRAYPDVIPGDVGVTPKVPPVFPLNWHSNFNDCVYNGVPCTEPTVGNGSTQMEMPFVTPSPSPEP